VAYVDFDAPVLFDTAGVYFDGLVIAPPRPLVVSGRDDTYIQVLGYDNTKLVVSGSFIVSIVVDLECDIGEDIDLTMNLTPPRSISGNTFSLKVMDYTGTVVLDVTGSIIDQVNGSAHFLFNTSNLLPASYNYKIWRTNVGANAVLTKGELLVA
jgi:hypothetical protein